MRLAYQEMLRPHMRLVTLVTVGAIAGILGLIGPIGTYEALTPVPRRVFCALIFLTSWPILYGLSVVTLYVVRSRPPLAAALALALAALFGAAPCTAIVYTVESLAQARDPAIGELLRLYVVMAAVAVGCSGLFLYVVCQRLKFGRGQVGGAAASVERAADGAGDTAAALLPVSNGAEPGGAGAEAGSGQLHKRTARPELDQSGSVVMAAESSDNGPPQQPQQPQQPPDVDQGDGAAQAPFLDLLPRSLGRDVIYLKSADHYIDVFTTIGSNLIKMRFADAVAELGDGPGTRVHRCYWVAYHHIEELVKRDRKYALRLTGNHEVPVSPTYRSAVRAAITRRAPAS